MTSAVSESLRAAQIEEAVHAGSLHARRSPSRRALGRVFASLTWKGLGLLAAVCAVNASRRTIQDLLGGGALGAWLVAMLAHTAHGLVIAIPVALAVVATYNLVSRVRWRYASLACAVAVASAGGTALFIVVEYAIACHGAPASACFGQSVSDLFIASWARYGVLSTLCTVVFAYVRNARESGAQARAAELQRAHFVQKSEEARLRMLQAQIEPHFLFNTLATVRRLYRTSPADGATILDDLMQYLAVALPQMRAADSTLGREVALTEAFLKIQKIRMGGRLAFGLDVPEPLRDARLPPMMLITLVENAVKHGLAPLPEGGAIDVSASAAGRDLVVRVADTGRGFIESKGGGTGLANIRARLAALHGGAARLTLAHNVPRGVVATLTMPLSMHEIRA